jgi:SAM-dependent methyltransferase
VLEWSHNKYYFHLLLRELPPQSRRVLDVGCGPGSFAAQLACQVDLVDAIDRSPAMIELARQQTPDNVNCILADAMSYPLPDGGYDAIFSICTLHHMPLQGALVRFKGLLRPGGVVAVIALPRRDLRHELPTEVVAALGHRLLGAAFWAARSLGSQSWFAKDTTPAAMPIVRDPPLTTREVADQAGAVLPGVRVRRLLFWRYLLRWQKPVEE